MSPKRSARVSVLIVASFLVSHAAGAAQNRGLPEVPSVPETGAQNYVPPWLLGTTSKAQAGERTSTKFGSMEHLTPRTFAITPRTIGLTFGPQYFERTSQAGPAHRGRAYNVKRRI